MDAFCFAGRDEYEFDENDRIAVLKEYRGRNAGSKLINVTKKEILNRNRDIAKLSAQIRAVAFYEKNGY